MNPNHERKYVRIRIKTLCTAGLILAAGVFGWWLGQPNDPQDNQTNTMQPTTAAPVPAATNNNASEADVRSLISYTLPFNWGEASCHSELGSVFVIPSGGSEANCSVANPSYNFISPVKISVDSANNTDCNQLQNVQDVSKHVCISLYINDLRSLKAETVYNRDSAYKRETTINAYYIDTGKGVVKVEYFHSPNDREYQPGFDQLASSIKKS